MKNKGLSWQASGVACLSALGQTGGAGMGGSSSGAPQPAVLDAEHRPITAGGFVKSGPVVFEDIAARAGLTRWRHTMGTPENSSMDARAADVCPDAVRTKVQETTDAKTSFIAGVPPPAKVRQLIFGFNGGNVTELWQFGFDAKPRSQMEIEKDVTGRSLPEKWR